MRIKLIQQINFVQSATGNCPRKPEGFAIKILDDLIAYQMSDKKKIFPGLCNQKNDLLKLRADLAQEIYMKTGGTNNYITYGQMKTYWSAHPKLFTSAMKSYNESYGQLFTTGNDEAVLLIFVDNSEGVLKNFFLTSDGDYLHKLVIQP